MLKMIGPINSGAATGGAGVATANADTNHIVSGFLYAIYVKYNHSPPAGTTDVSITTKGTSPAAPAQTLLAVANGAADGYYYPRVVENLAGTGAALLTYTRLAVHDIVNVKILQADDLDNIDVWLWLEC